MPDARLAPLLADAGGVWGAIFKKLRFFLATIGVFLRAEPTPHTPGHVLVPLTAGKPGSGLWVVPGHACLALGVWRAVVLPAP